MSRNYSTDEIRALRAAFGLEAPMRGPAQHACGPYWPGELRTQAKQYERLIPLLRLAADALEREIAADPRCTQADPKDGQ